MNLTRKKTQAPAVAEAPAETGGAVEMLQQIAAAQAVLADNGDEDERAADCLEQAEALRESVAGLVPAAQDRLAQAEQEAARIIADARRALNAAQQQAATVEREAAGIADTGRSYAAAARLGELIVEARKQAEGLAQERLARLAEAAALQSRLDDLAGCQRASLAALQAAKDAVDVEAAGAAQTALNGLEAVRPTLETQHAAAMARAAAIGDENGAGEYAAAQAAIQRFTAERETALDHARPERVEARYAANPGMRLAEMLATPGVAEAWAEHYGPKTEQPKAIHQHADGRVSGRGIASSR